MQWASKSHMAPATYHHMSVGWQSKSNIYQIQEKDFRIPRGNEQKPANEWEAIALLWTVVFIVLLVGQLITSSHTSMPIVSRLPSPMPTVCIRHYTERNKESIPWTTWQGQCCRSRDKKSTYYPFSPMLKNNLRFVRFLFIVHYVIFLSSRDTHSRSYELTNFFQRN